MISLQPLSKLLQRLQQYIYIGNICYLPTYCLNQFLILLIILLLLPLLPLLLLLLLLLLPIPHSAYQCEDDEHYLFNPLTCKGIEMTIPKSKWTGEIRNLDKLNQEIVLVAVPYNKKDSSKYY